MPTLVNDGSVSYGSRSLTIDGVVYATDDFTLSPEISEIVRTDENNVPDGLVTIAGLTRGSATLQLADESTAVPEMGDTFTEDAVVYVVQTVGRAETKAGETKVAITFYDALNPSDIVVT